MKTVFVILTILSSLMMLSTLICGLWMRAQDQVEASSVNFHMGLGIATLALVVITLGVAYSRIA
jgi:cytochrome b561